MAVLFSLFFQYKPVKAFGRLFSFFFQFHRYTKFLMLDTLRTDSGRAFEDKRCASIIARFCRPFALVSSITLNMSHMWNWVAICTDKHGTIVTSSSADIQPSTWPTPKASFRAPWMVGDAMVVRGNAGWIMSKNGRPCPCPNCAWGPPAEKTGRESLLDHPSCPPYNQINQGTELNWLWYLIDFLTRTAIVKMTHIKVQNLKNCVSYVS